MEYMLIVYGLVSLVTHGFVWFLTGIGCNANGYRSVWRYLLSLPLAPLVPIGIFLVILVAAVRKVVTG